MSTNSNIKKLSRKISTCRKIFICKLQIRPYLRLNGQICDVRALSVLFSKLKLTPLKNDYRRFEESFNLIGAC